jgi:hypothetical protein
MLSFVNPAVMSAMYMDAANLLGYGIEARNSGGRRAWVACSKA